MTYYTGIDVSLRSVSISVADDKGEVCLEAKVAADVDAIVDRLRRFSEDVKSVGFEAGTLTKYLTYGLQAAGFEVICLEARQVSLSLAAMRNKTDRNDARGLAQILRTGWYSQAHVKSLHSHQVRALLASRKAILKKCIDLENELRGLLKVFGIRLPSRVGHGSFDAELRETVSSDEMLACALVPLLDARTVLYKTYLKLDNAVKALVLVDPVCHRLMSIPGIGPVTALTFKAAVDDPKPLQVLTHCGSAPRADAAALPVRRARQPWTYLQSGRRRCSLNALHRRALAAHSQRSVVDVEGVGCSTRQDTWPSPRGDRRGPQAGSDPASHVGRRL